eukprot:gene9440-8898_t
MQTPTPQDIVSHGQGIDYDDVIVCEVRIDHAMKDANPMDKVEFFKPDGRLDVQTYESYKIPQERMSNMFTEKYQ